PRPRRVIMAGVRHVGQSALFFFLLGCSFPLAQVQDSCGHDRYGDPLPPGVVRRFGTVRFRDGSTFLHNPVFTPDGKIIVTGNGEGVLWLWEAESGRPLRRIPSKVGVVGSWAVSPDGTR